MSTMVSVRTFARGGNVSLGDKTLRSDKTAYVNIDNRRVMRDIARHSSIGQIFPYGDTYFQNDDGVVTQGGKVTVRTTTLVTDVSATYITRAGGGLIAIANAGTATIGAANVTDPRIDIIAVDTSGAGAFVVIAGTATANANLTNRLGMAALPANCVALAIVLVPNTATTLSQDNVVDVRP